MKSLIASKRKSRIESHLFEEYQACVGELRHHELVHTMSGYIQHSDVTCLEHSMYVSFTSFLVCKKLGLDHVSAARGALLHDFFLYDWHVNGTRNGLHGFTHPYTALKNATLHFDLNEVEKDIIVKHMWPMTIVLPKYRESFVVLLVDKYCATREIFRVGVRKRVNLLKAGILAT